MLGHTEMVQAAVVVSLVGGFGVLADFATPTGFAGLVDACTSMGYLAVLALSTGTLTGVGILL